MSERDEALGSDLKAAFGTDLPGDEFDRAVMDRIEAGAGGEHEVTADLPRRPRLRLFLPAAAAVLLVLAGWAMFGRGEGGTAATGEEETSDRYDVRVLAVDVYQVGEERYDGKALLALLAEKRPEKVLIAGRRDLPWRSAALAMQTCAAAEIADLALRVDGEPAVPTPLPKDEGLQREPIEEVVPQARFRLRVVDGETVSSASASKVSTSGVAEIHADSDVPFRDIVETARLCRKKGFERIQFVGTPPVDAPKQEILVILERVDGETRLSLYDTSGQHSMEEGIGKLAKEIERRGDPAFLCGRVRAAPKVPHEDVVKVLDAFMRGKINEITYVGAPPRTKAR